ncbi:cwf21 domain-containing protein [Daedaleopsis nitida]|nr:cwf21 domain-containing protein [Daedaleopsis nitida]
MYNGIGLTTPRGSGTNGYVVRNLSAVRSHQSVQDRASAWDVAPPKHREPDAEILEHERKRKVEIKCLELQLQLEEDGVDEEKIEEQVNALRTKLLAEASALVQDAKALKPSDTHGIAAAKKDELNKMARALGTRRDYNEGDAFDREKQEEQRIRRMAEREERERQRDEERAKMQAQKEKWEAERKERDRLRRREEDRRRKERDEESKRRERMPRPRCLLVAEGTTKADAAGAEALCTVVAPQTMIVATGAGVHRRRLPAAATHLVPLRLHHASGGVSSPALLHVTAALALSSHRLEDRLA